METASSVEGYILDKGVKCGGAMKCEEDEIAEGREFWVGFE